MNAVYTTIKQPPTLMNVPHKSKSPCSWFRTKVSIPEGYARGYLGLLCLKRLCLKLRRIRKPVLRVASLVKYFWGFMRNYVLYVNTKNSHIQRMRFLILGIFVT